MSILRLTNIAPTEDEKQYRLQLLTGYVHDPGAAMFGDVAGQLGLFSNVHDSRHLIYHVIEWRNMGW